MAEVMFKPSLIDEADGAGLHEDLQLHPGHGHRQQDGYVLEHRAERRKQHVPRVPDEEREIAALPAKGAQGEQGGNEKTEERASYRGPATQEAHGLPWRGGASGHHEGQGRLLDLEAGVAGEGAAALQKCGGLGF